MQLALGQPNTVTYALAALVVAALAFLPGLPLAAGLARRAGWRLSATLCAAFALQVGVVGVVALAAHYLGLPLAFVLAVSVAALAILGAAAMWPLRPWRPAPGSHALILGGAGLALGVFERTWFARMADAFYHLAAVRSLLATGRPMVTDPMFRTSSTVLDPTAGVWHTVLAVWSKATGLDVAAWLWPGATAVGAALLLMAFWELARTLSGSDGAATAGTLAWLVVGLAADMRWAEYPNRLSLALAFVALTALASLADTPRWPEAALAVAAGFGTAAMHMAAAEMLAAAGGVLVVMLAARASYAAARGLTTRWRPAAAVAGAGAAAGLLALPLLLPKTELVRTSSLVGFKAGELAAGVVRLPGGWLIDSPGHLMKVAPPLFLLGAAIAAWATVRAFRRGEPRDAVTAALTSLPLVLLADPLVTTPLLNASYYLTERIAILLPFTVFLGVAWAGALPGSRADRAAIAAVVAAALAAGVAFYAISRPPSWSPSHRDSIFSSRTDDVRLQWGADTVARLAAEFGDRYPIVASDTQTSYYLSGVLPVAVVGVTSKHTAFAIEAADGQRRRDDMDELMAASTTDARRREILTRRRADYVVVRKTPGMRLTLASMLKERGLLHEVVDTPAMIVFRVSL
ncbi:MAG TPA: DUF6541 family protein [Coriobacteriia bacterium]|jgi:hypothetical protein